MHAAIGVCALVAQPVAQLVSQESGHTCFLYSLFIPQKAAAPGPAVKKLNQCERF